MKTIAPEPSLRSVLRALALPGASQLKLYPRSYLKVVCPNCRFSGLYRDWSRELGGAAYAASLPPERQAALDGVAAAAEGADVAPCHEDAYLKKGEAFEALRVAAKEALAAFGWDEGAPEPEHLWGHPACAALVKEAREAERLARRKARRPDGNVEDFADIAAFDPRPFRPAEFLALVPNVPWFAHLGEPHPRDDRAERIGSWRDWGGPESLMSTFVGTEQSAWQDAILEAAGPDRERVDTTWQTSLREFEERAVRGFDRARDEEKARLEAEGKDEEEGFYESIGDDPWHGPTNAVNCAAWVATTIAFCLEIGRPIPTNALRQWAWFARGHWACGYSPDDLERLDLDGSPESLERLEGAWVVVL